MKLAVDFGTSYSAAALLVSGRVEMISFGDSKQFRTSVFFPSNLPSVLDFHLTPEIEREVTLIVQKSKNDQTQEIKRTEALRQEAYKLPTASREKALSMIPQIRLRSDDELYREAVNAARRNWLTQQTRAALAGAASLDEAVYGEEAVDAYLQGNSGHLVSSPKSMLGFSLIGEARSILTGVTSKILSHVKHQAELQTGHKFDQLLLGRPVNFKSSRGDLGTRQAIEIIRTAALAAGFNSVDFLEEPIAASWHVHRTYDASPTRMLIVDVGGGTTDLAFGLVGGSAHRPAIERAWGLAKGGTDIDVSLSMKSFMPAFGKNRHNIPNHIFYQASSVHDLVRQKEFSTRDVSAYPPPYSDRLRQLQAPGATVRLNRAVERTKIFLSEHERAQVRLGYIEEGLSVRVARTDLEDCCERFARELSDLIGQAISESNAVEAVYLTGGASRTPFVAALVQAAIGDSPLIVGEPSYAVISGLAHAAGEAQAPT